MHPGVQFHPDGDGLRQLSLLQRFQLLRAVYRRMQLLRGNNRQIGRIKETFQQQDRFRDTASAQAQGFFETGDAKGIGIRERSRGLEKTVSVSVRFHHCNQFTGRCQFTQTLQVVSQSAAVNDNSCRLHLNSLIKRSPKSCVFAQAFLNSACAGPKGRGRSPGHATNLRVSGSLVH